MSNAFDRLINTPARQTEQENANQVKNNAGGFVHKVTTKVRLERFLILGTDKGTYYQEERDLTKQNLTFLIEAINEDEVLYWNTVRDVCVNNRAFKNSPAIIALSYLFKYGKIKDVPAYFRRNVEGDIKLGKIEGFKYETHTAKNLFKYVIRTATHLKELEKYAKYLKLSGRAYRTAIQSWYKTESNSGMSWLATNTVQKTVESVAYQAIKYRQRHGFTHRDTLRLTHPKHLNDAVAKFILGKENNEDVPNIILGYQELQAAQTVGKVLSILDDPRFKDLPWEALPTEFHKSPEVWKKLFYNGSLNGQALVRNITRLARIEAFDDMTFVADYAERLADEDMVKRTRLHPISFLNALIVHEDGQVYRPDYNKVYRSPPVGYYNKDYIDRVKNWKSNPKILDALTAGYYTAFKYVEPSKKRFFLGIDVSGSMSYAAMGLDMSCAKLAGAMAMAIARTEPYYLTYGFTASTRSAHYGRRVCTSDSITDLMITPNQNLKSVFSTVQKENFGATDCSLPMEWAIQNNVDVDCFVVLTDNETYAGKRHPHVALEDYRQKRGIDAKLVVVAMTSTEFSIANPKDSGMLDVAGGDSNLPKLVSEFALGNI